MRDVRGILTSPELVKRLPGALRSQLGWMFYRGGHRLLDALLFESGRIDWLDRAELIDRAVASDRLWRFGDVEEYSLVEPLESEFAPREIRRRSKTARLDQPFVCELENATLFGRDAIGRTNDGQIILETTEHSDATVETGNCQRNLFWNLVDDWRKSNFDQPQTSGPVCPLVDPWSRRYFHWYVDALAKLEGVAHYAEVTGEEPTLIIPNEVPSWMARSLELLGYNPDDCIRWNGRTKTYGRVVVPSLRRRVDTPSIDALRWLAEEMKSRIEPDRTEWSSRVYISRRQAESRRVVNEPALEESLADLGFESYVLENLSVDDQISLFSQADIAVGYHGAGFTNTIFGNDMTVVDLFGAMVHSTVYWHIASGLGFRYSAVECPSLARDISVDPDRITGVVERILDS